MTTKTISSLYDTHEDAANAVRDLESAGIPHDTISMVANNADNRLVRDGDTDSGAGTGATIGTVMGGGAGLLAGLGAVVIPGIGPVVAAGWLVSTLVGAAAGAATGGLIGAMTDSGVNADDAHIYAEGVRRGGTLVTVRMPEAQAMMADAILQRHHPVDPAMRGTDYRSSGWREFDIETPAPTIEEVERERARYRRDRAA